MSRTFGLLAAVKVPGANTKPVFVGLIEDGERWTLYWHAGERHCSFAQSEVEVVKVYASSVFADDYDVIDEAEVEYLTDYGPQPQPPCARLGWVAPNGDWYPCAYVAHHDLASLLLRVKYNTSGGEFDLKKKGWIAVKGSGIISLPRSDTGVDRYTVEQKLTMLKVLEEFERVETESPDTNWEAILLSNPEDYALQHWLTSPTDDYHGRRFPEALRDTYELYFGEDTDHNTPTSPPEEMIRVRRIGEHPGD